MYDFKFISGHVKDYDVVIAGDVVTVIDAKRIITKQKIEGLGSFITKTKDFKLGWAAFPDFEVIYLYDKGDENFGYALNIDDPILSEWGYAPFS